MKKNILVWVWKKYIGAIESILVLLLPRKASPCQAKDPAEKLIGGRMGVVTMIFRAMVSRKILVISLIILLIGLPILYYSLTHQRKIEAAWMDDNWGYRQTVAITNGNILVITMV